MENIQRPYRNWSDLGKVGTLIRQIYKLDSYWNSWSYALYDIWAQRKLGDEIVFGKTDWHQDLRFWENSQGELVSVAVYRDPTLVKIVYPPDALDLAEPMLAWVEERFLTLGIKDKQLTIESIESNPHLEELLTSRGYKKETGHYILREKLLGSRQTAPVQLPEGFSIKQIETLNELDKFHLAVHKVFNFMDNPEVYQILRRAPSFVPELDLIVLSDTQEVVAFASTWYESKFRLGEFEPVGTVPGYRKLGLGTAVIAETCNRLRKLGCRKVSVMSWSESVGANSLYEKAGLLAKAKKNYWSWDTR